MQTNYTTSPNSFLKITESLLIDEHRHDIAAILKDGIREPAKLFGSQSFSISAGTRPDGVIAPWETSFMQDSLGSWHVTFTADRFYNRKFRAFTGIDLMGNSASRSILSSHPIVKMLLETIMSNSENVMVNVDGKTVLKSSTHLALPLKIVGREIGKDTDVSLEFSYSSPDHVNIVLSSLTIRSETGVRQFNLEYKAKLLPAISDKFYTDFLEKTENETRDIKFLPRVISSSQQVYELSTITENHFDQDGNPLESSQDQLNWNGIGSTEWIREHYDSEGSITSRSYVGVVDAGDLQYWETQKSVISRLGIPKDFADVRVWNKETGRSQKKKDIQSFLTLAELVQQAKLSGRKFLLRVVQERNSNGVLATVAIAADELHFGEKTLEEVKMTETVEWEKVVALPIHGKQQNIILHFGEDPQFADIN